MNLYQVFPKQGGWSVYCLAVDAYKAKWIVASEIYEPGPQLRYKKIADNVNCNAAGVILREDQLDELIGGAGLEFDRKAAALIRSYRDGPVPTKQYTCAQCGETFIGPKAKSNPAKFCPECRERRRHASTAESKAKYEAKAKYKRARVRMRGADPALSFADIRAVAEEEYSRTGRRPHYGEIAARPYLEQQAREMEERRRAFYAALKR